MRPHLDAPDEARPLAFAGGAGLVDGPTAWVLVDGPAARSLGPSLAWARSVGADRLQLIVDADAGILARRAACFAAPPGVWRVEGSSMVPASAEPLPDDPPVDPRVAPFADVLALAGCDPVVEHGSLLGEVEGLEVARVVVDDRGAHLEVGVGRFDREANALTAGDEPSAATLARAVELVRRHRRADAAPHPLRRLAAARWLRARVMADPALVGADHLAPMAPTLPAPDLRTPWPAPATGTDVDGRPLVVVCSVGVDLDLVPSAADARLADGRDARLVLALPPRDDLPVTRALAAALAEPAEVVTVAPEGDGR